MINYFIVINFISMPLSHFELTKILFEPDQFANLFTLTDSLLNLFPLLNLLLALSMNHTLGSFNINFNQ